MKKVKYIALAFILMLSLIGGAYAYWTDQVVVSGTVSTAEMDTKWTAFYIRDAASGHHTHCVLPEYTTAEAKIDPADPTGKTALLKIENLYPRGTMTSLVWPLTDVVGVSGIVENCGSIPVKFSGAEIEIVDPNGATDYVMVITRLGHTPKGGAWYEIAHTGAPGVPLSGLADWITQKMLAWNGTIQPGDIISFGENTMYFYLVGDAPKDAALEFTLELNFTQWNAP